ncbi:MAG: hypothetical protein DMF89_10920 [Acidobacteria bacterium]|nr:MAG: hypothetical protein DMF89_10920 [Acidobacteriota bacterium]
MSVIVKPGPTCALLRLAATLSLSLSTATKTRGAMDSQRRTDMRCTLVFIAGLSVSVLSAIAGPIEDQQTPPASRSVDRIPDTATAARLAREGQRLTAEQAKALEVRLETTPDDLPARARLLGYYFATAIKVGGPEATRAARRRHILWMIAHHPENDLTALPECTIDRAGHALADADGYGQARTLWLDQVRQRNDNVRVLLHAAAFFRLPDKALALTLLKQAVRLAPSDSDIASRLGYTYAISVLGITMINNNGLPMAANPADAAGEAAQTAINDLRVSSNPVVVAVAGSVLSQYGAIVGALTKGAVNVLCASHDERAEPRGTNGAGAEVAGADGDGRRTHDERS